MFALRALKAVTLDRRNLTNRMRARGKPPPNDSDLTDEIIAQSIAHQELTAHRLLTLVCFSPISLIIYAVFTADHSLRNLCAKASAAKQRLITSAKSSRSSYTLSPICV